MLYDRFSFNVLANTCFDADERNHVDDEGRADASDHNQHTGEGRTRRASQVEFDGVQCRGGGKI
jgi:hypothetical protein